MNKKLAKGLININFYNCSFLFLFQGFSSLHLAALHGRLSCVQFLIEQRKVPIDLPSEPHKWTPLHLSINHETSERGYRCMIFLIQNGANLTAYVSHVYIT